MDVLHVDPAKHPHPRRYRRALAWCIFGCTTGIALTVIGLWLVQRPLEGALLWLASIVLVGPSLVFLSLVAFATYLESLEAKKYGEIYQEQGGIGRPGTNP